MLKKLSVRGTGVVSVIPILKYINANNTFELDARFEK